jgi:RNA polymerase sigma-70 factor, ECF subfamily
MPASSEFPETRPSLLNALREGPAAEGWRDFYRRYAPAVYRVARLRGLHEHDAEDIVQQVMLETAAHLGDFEYRAGRHRFRSWIRVIAENKIVDLRRRRRPTVHDDEVLAGCVDEAETLDELWEREWKLQDVLWCLEQVALDISPRRMQAFRMYSLDGRPAEEVAEALDMTAGYVYVTRCQVLNLVRRRLAKLNEEGHR